MAKKTNKKPGGSNKKNSALTMKKRDNNILHSKITKIILLLMAFSFVAVYLFQLIYYMFIE